MHDFSEITLNDKALFDKYLNIYKPQISDLTFTNLFMWRNYYKFRFAVISDLLCIIGVPDNKEPFAFVPVGNIQQDNFDQAVQCLREYFKSKGWKVIFKRVPEENTEHFKSYVKSDIEISYDRDNSDYIYSASDLIYLKGKKFDGKRNHINKFKKLYGYEYVELRSALIDECYKIMDTWCSERECNEHSEFYCEKIANTELLSNYDYMGCKGALIKVNGKFEAFTVGEMLNSDTAVIHIEKANSKVNGLYTFINQQFCENAWGQASYINREQDLGVEGLRKAKLSYNPVRMSNKYTVFI